VSAPINQKENSQDPLLYAPPWARAQAARRDPQSTTSLPLAANPRPLAASSLPPAATSPLLSANSLPPAANSLPPAANLGDSKINWLPAPAKLARFEGDVGMTELRQRLSLDPHIVPEPPVQMQQRSLAHSWLTKLPLYVGLAAVFVYAVVKLDHSYADRPIAPNSDTGVVKASQLTLTPSYTQPITAAPLVDRKAFLDKPPLVGATASLNGLVKSSRLSTAESLGSTGGRVPAGEFGSVLAYASHSSVGSPDADIAFPGANARLAPQIGKLEWIMKSLELGTIAGNPFERGNIMQPEPEPAAASLDAEKLSRLTKRGLDFLKDGDIAASRLVLRLAADSGNAQAAQLLGDTFNPVVLAELGVFGLTGDPATARAWYQKAVEFGSTEATRRIERLAQTVK
jgi:hypothetical protein